MNHHQARPSTARYAWTGFAAGIACMTALFALGLHLNEPGLVIMSSTLAALLGSTWGITSAATRKREAR